VLLTLLTLLACGPEPPAGAYRWQVTQVRSGDDLGAVIRDSWDQVFVLEPGVYQAPSRLSHVRLVGEDREGVVIEGDTEVIDGWLEDLTWRGDFHPVEDDQGELFAVRVNLEGAVGRLSLVQVQSSSLDIDAEVGLHARQCALSDSQVVSAGTTALWCRKTTVTGSTIEGAPFAVWTSVVQFGVEEGITIRDSTIRDGNVGGGATTFELDDVRLFDSPEYALQFREGDPYLSPSVATLTDVYIEDPEWGGIWSDGSGFTAEGLDVRAPNAVGVYVSYADFDCVNCDLQAAGGIALLDTGRTTLRATRLRGDWGYVGHWTRPEMVQVEAVGTTAAIALASAYPPTLDDVLVHDSAVGLLLDDMSIPDLGGVEFRANATDLHVQGCEELAAPPDAPEDLSSSICEGRIEVPPSP